MSTKTDWQTLSHEQQIRALAEIPIDQIAQDYHLEGYDTEAFRGLLAKESRLWDPQNVQEFREKGKPPTKDVVLGAWRDLERSEALLELIDNSIDAWLQRKQRYPTKTAPELNIYITIEEDSQLLTYEDNAGGVSTDKLDNLVVPGYSETTALLKTIGSYKTGGKKAIFRLANAAQIMARYWNPAETTDEAVAIQLDKTWMNDPDRYEFPYAVLKDKSVLEKGQTRYILQLREEPIGGPPWFQTPEQVNKITQHLSSTYSLLMIRNPSIHIFFLDRQKPLVPILDLFDFSGNSGGGIDIRPQQVIYEIQLDYEGRKHPVEIEIVFGCRPTVGVREGRTGGIDLYGNDRLFVAYDQNTFSHLLPTGSSRNLIRGFVNIHGANIFIPWDTHKRHLNVDREIMHIITKHPAIQQLFENWRKAYNDISRSGRVTELISPKLPKIIDREENDLFIPHRQRVEIDPQRKRKVSLPRNVFVPKVTSSAKKNDLITVPLKFNLDEARLLASHYGISGELPSPGTTNELANEIKGDLLKKAGRSSSRTAR